MYDEVLYESMHQVERPEMVNAPTSFSQTELTVWQRIDACYADSYEPKLPGPFEIAAVAFLMPIAATFRVLRWLGDKVCDLGPVVPVILALFFGMLAIFVPLFLHGVAK